jgi:hypothetical protein
LVETLLCEPIRANTNDLVTHINLIWFMGITEGGLQSRPVLPSYRRPVSGGSQKFNREKQKMFSMTKVALSAAIVLSAALPASAAKHLRVGHGHPAIHVMVRDTVSSTCSPIHAPLCSNICTGPGPCAPPDGW